MLKSLIIAFSTYSRIPMPRVEWEEKNMRWSICFFPLVGLVIGALEYLWLWLTAALLPLPGLLRAAIAAVLPILLTGGIHLDGFCDTVDALASHQDRERKLEIMKDPNTGAFAVIYCAVWLLLYFVCWTNALEPAAALAAGVGFVLSRALSGLAVVNWPQARKQGMLRSVADASRKTAVTIVMLVYIALCLAVLVLLCGWLGVGVIGICAVTFLGYRLVSCRVFGGVTGDLAGCFVCLAELGTVFILAIMESVL